MIEFKYDDEYDGTTIVASTHATSPEAVIGLFERWYVASGWGIPEGYHLGYEEDDIPVYEEAEKPPQGMHETHMTNVDCSSKCCGSAVAGDPLHENSKNEELEQPAKTEETMEDLCYPDDLLVDNPPETLPDNSVTNPPQLGKGGEDSIRPEEVVESLRLMDLYPAFTIDYARTLAAAVRELAWALYNPFVAADEGFMDNAVAIAKAVVGVKE